MLFFSNFKYRKIAGKTKGKIMTLFEKSIEEHLTSLKELNDQQEKLNSIINGMSESIANGGKIWIFGNGGNAANAHHFSEKLLGRVHCEQKCIPAICLNSDSSVMSSIANDDGFENIFASQINALANPKDVCFGITTSGRSSNILNAFKAAKQIGCKVYGFTGYGTLEFDTLCDMVLKIEEGDYYAVQEMHLIALNILSKALST